MIRVIEKIIAPIKRRMRLMITRGVVSIINDAGGLQTLQVSGLSGELLDNIERLQQYGFTAHPHADSDCLLLNVGANRSHAIVISVDDRRYRLHLKQGEVAIYDDLGQSVQLLRSGIEIHAPQGLTITGDTIINGMLTNNSINVTGHNHTGDSGGSTGVMQ